MWVKDPEMPLLLDWRKEEYQCREQRGLYVCLREVEKIPIWSLIFCEGCNHQQRIGGGESEI